MGKEKKKINFFENFAQDKKCVSFEVIVIKYYIYFLTLATYRNDTWTRERIREKETWTMLSILYYYYFQDLTNFRFTRLRNVINDKLAMFIV